MIELDGEYYNFQCPHCMEWTQVHKNDINCRIFRHAVYRSNGQPINPHTKKEICDLLRLTNKIFGCGKPFRLVPDGRGFDVEICDYI